MNQQDSIKAHLLSGATLNLITANRLFQCVKVGTVVSRLKKQGLDVRTRPTQERNGLGELIKCNEYYVNVK
jgi:hypothetical protein